MARLFRFRPVISDERVKAMAEGLGSGCLRGVLRGFDGTSFTAVVEPLGSPGHYLSAVRVSRAIPPAEMTLGRTVYLLSVDATNPAEAMIVGVY